MRKSLFTWAALLAVLPIATATAPWQRGSQADPGKPAAPAARVLVTAPQGQVASTVQLQVTFDRPVASLGESEVVGLFIAIEPPCAGGLRWASPELLVFEPRELTPATRYRARLEWRGAGASPVAGLPVSWTFETPGPELESLRPYEEIGVRAPIIAELTQPVTLRDVRRHLEVVRAPDDEEEGAHEAGPVDTALLVPTRITAATAREVRRAAVPVDDDDRFARGLRAGASRFWAIRPLARWPLDGSLAVNLKPGLLGTIGEVPSRGGVLRLQAEVDAFQIVDGSCWREDCEAGDDISVTLSSPISRRQLSKVRITPRPAWLRYHLFDESDEGAGRAIAVEGTFIAGTTYRLIFPADMKDVKGRTLGSFNRGRDVVLNVPFVRRPTLTLSSTQGVFALPTPPRLGVETRFLSTVAIRSAPVSPQRAAALLWASSTGERSAPLPEAAATERRTLQAIGPNGWAETVLDLDQLTGAQRGMTAVEVRPGPSVPGTSGPAPEPELGHFQRTDLAPVGWASAHRLVVLPLRHTDLAPASDIALGLVTPSSPPQRLGQTGTKGLLDVALPGGWPSGAVLMVSQRDGSDVHYQRVPLAPSPTSAERARAAGKGIRIYATVERDFLRPGDDVHVVGWAVADAPEAASGLTWLPQGMPVGLTLSDRGRLLDESRTQLDATGKFSGRLRVGAKPQLGRGMIAIAVGNHERKISVRIEDVQPPTLQLRLQAPAAVVAGRDLALALEARRLSSEPAALSAVEFASTCREVRAPPPSLLRVEAGWQIGVEAVGAVRSDGWRHDGRLDDGTLTEVIERDAFVPGDRPLQCQIDVIATDLTRQQVAETTATFIHPRPAYLALHAPASVHAGEDAAVKVRIIDSNGARRAGRALQITAEPGRTGRSKRSRVVARCKTSVALAEDATCSFGALAPGFYIIRARDPAGLAAPAMTTTFVSRRRRDRPPSPATLRADPGLRMTFSTPKPAPGDIVHVTITAPSDGAGMLIVDRSGIREHHAFTTRDGKATVEMHAKESWVPGVTVKIAQPVRSIGPAGDARVRLQQLARPLEVSHASRTLSLSLEAPSQARPGAKVPVKVSVKGHDGKPVNARLALWAVDEAFLLKTGFRVQDPVKALLPGAEPKAHLLDPFAGLLEPYRPRGADPSTARGHGSGTLGGGSGYGRGSGVVHGHSNRAAAARRRVPSAPVPVFIADLATGHTGEAFITMQMPDDLTRLRITALASAPLPDGGPGRFGMAERSIEVQQPLALRLAAPRLLRPGDRTEIAAVIRNMGDHDGIAEITAAMLPSGDSLVAAIVSAPATVRVALRKDEEIRVPFTVEATRPGTVLVDLSVVLHRLEGNTSSSAADAMRVPLAIEAEPAAVDRSAIYLTLADRDSTSMAVRVPAGTAPGGGVTVVPTLSLLGEGFDAARFLVDYPHGCAEQTASALVGMTALRELHARGVAVSPPSDALLEARIGRLLSMQTEAGGFAYWPGSLERPDPTITAYVTWALAHAHARGAPIPAAVLENAARFLGKYVASQLARGRVSGELSFTLAALAAAGKPTPAEAVDLLHRNIEALDPSALAALILAIASANEDDPRLTPLASRLAATLAQTPAMARIPRSATAAGTTADPFASSTRTHALVALALLRTPAHTRGGERLVRGLLDERRDGRWRTTPDNAFALMTLAEQAGREKPGHPAILRAALDDRPLIDGDLRVAGNALVGFIPREALPLPGPQGHDLPLSLSLRGGGPAYVRIASEWILADPPPRAQGLALSRSLHDENRRPLITAREGDTLSCTLTIRVHVPLRFVAATVPLPAGLEVAIRRGRGGAIAAGAFSHHEAWRDRVSLYADRLEPGQHTITIPVRAVTPGDYLVPAATAEAMYEPEIAGRTERTRIRVTRRDVD